MQELFVGSTVAVVWALLTVADAAMIFVVDPVSSLGRMAWRALRPKQAIEPSRVLVLGSSFAGLTIRNELHGDDFDITLVDRKDYFEYTPGILRCAVQPKKAEELCAKIQPPRNGRFVKGEVWSVGKKSAQIRIGDSELQEIPFDYCVIAIGSEYRAPWKTGPGAAGLEERAATWEGERARLEQAKSVIIIGAGLVGVELAGEVAAAWPGKAVTLVDRAAGVCEGMPAGARNHVQQWLKKKGVRMVLGRSLRSFDEQGCELEDGTSLQADLVYPCMGFKAGGGGLHGSLGDATEAGGAIRVDECLQVEGRPGVFAVGDVMRHVSAELKMGHTAEMNAHVVAHSIRNMARGLPALAYPEGLVGKGRPTPRIACVSLGPHDGVVVFNWLVITGPLAAVVKWLIEWTKVASVRRGGGGAGGLFWRVADAASLFLSKHVVRGPPL